MPRNGRIISSIAAQPPASVTTQREAVPMAVSTPNEFIALQRFGLGARPGDLNAIASDPRGAVLAEISPDTVLISAPGLYTTTAALEAYAAVRAARKEARKTEAADATMDADPAMMEESVPGKGKGKKKRADAAPQNNPLGAELAARFTAAASAQIGFAERWAMFWSNHFAVEAGAGGPIRWMAGAYDREAIRPHVFGSFHELLLAATKHPAMLRYLNNATSIGPDSKAGLKRGKGLNENHARELLELHTIGVDAGYTQADVTAFANILTGWTFGMGKGKGGYGEFTFNQAAHEPGPQTVLGTAYDQRGVKQGEAVLTMLAAHPATARHIATKLARAFVADTPSPDLIDRLAAVFTDTKGDLAQLARALVTDDLAWSEPMEKIRLPQEYILAAVRALDIAPKPGPISKALNALGQPLFDPPSPQGFADDAATWLAPDALVNRLEVAQTLASMADASADARSIADAVLGPHQSDATRQAVARAEGPVQGLALMLMSPEFQRR